LANSLALSLGAAFTDLAGSLVFLAAVLLVGFALTFLTGTFADFVAGLARTLVTDLVRGLLTFLAATFVTLAFNAGLAFFANGFAEVLPLLTGLLVFLLAGTLETGFFIVIFAMVGRIS
jgi:hypothetical protein